AHFTGNMPAEADVGFFRRRGGAACKQSGTHKQLRAKVQCRFHTYPISREFVDDAEQNVIVAIRDPFAAVPKTERPPVGQKPQAAPWLKYAHFVNFARHHDALDALALEAADHAAQP